MKVRIGRWKIELVQRRKRRVWMAYRRRSPFFCFEHASKTEAIKTAARVQRHVETYARMREGNS